MATNSHLRIPGSARIVIIGGGTGGIITAALARRAGAARITLIEPCERHFYQPLWTLVGGGVSRPESSVRPEAELIPRGVRWLRERVAEIDPPRRLVTTEAGGQVPYDALVVAAGIQLNWEGIPGLREAIQGGYASTNYTYELAPRTWELIRNFRGGVALFHMPGTPIKCPGAPQKILYLAADHFRRRRAGGEVQLIYGSATAGIFAAPQYAAPLNAALARYGVDARFGHELVEIKPQTREAVFLAGKAEGKDRVTIAYDMLHAVPPQSAPDFIRRGPLAGGGLGWVEVDQFTLQHRRYPSVFALGDAAGTPNAKTGAAASRQALVVAANLAAVLADRPLAAHYNGYIACPIVTANGRVLLCELDYSGQPAPSIPYGDPFRERYDMWLLKRHGLPWLYWNVLLKGRRLPWVARPRRGSREAEAATA